MAEDTTAFGEMLDDESRENLEEGLKEARREKTKYGDGVGDAL